MRIRTRGRGVLTGLWRKCADRRSRPPTEAVCAAGFSGEPVGRIIHHVTTDEPQVDVRAELERVEREIAVLGPQIREIRERLADPGDGRDRTEMLTMAEEQEAIVAVLQERAEVLRQRLERT